MPAPTRRARRRPDPSRHGSRRACRRRSGRTRPACAGSRRTCPGWAPRGGGRARSPRTPAVRPGTASRERSTGRRTRPDGRRPARRSPPSGHRPPPASGRCWHRAPDGSDSGGRSPDERDPDRHGRIVPDRRGAGANYQILGVEVARIGDGAARRAPPSSQGCPSTRSSTGLPWSSGSFAAPRSRILCACTVRLWPPSSCTAATTPCVASSCPALARTRREHGRAGRDVAAAAISDQLRLEGPPGGRYQSPSP